MYRRTQRLSDQVNKKLYEEMEKITVIFVAVYGRTIYRRFGYNFSTVHTLPDQF